MAQAQGDSDGAPQRGAGNPPTDGAARALFEEAQALGEGQGADICIHQGHLLLEWGDYAAARSRYEEGLALRRATGDPCIAWALLEVGHAAWLQGEPEITQSYTVEAVGVFRESEDKEGLLAALESLAVAALAQGRNARAARLLGAAVAQREALDLYGPEWWHRPRQRVGEATRAASLEQVLAPEWAEGQAIPLEQAVRVALEA